MRDVGILEAKTHLSSLVEAVERGGEVIHITRHGRRVARLTGETEANPQATIRPSRVDLVAQFRALRAQIAANGPTAQNLTWENLKEDMRR